MRLRPPHNAHMTFIATGSPAAALRWALLPHPAGTAAEPPARAWLGEALGCSPSTVALSRDARGRPHLPAPLDCNWSHSADHLLVALGTDVRLGVDLEALRPRPRALDLAARYFAPAETAWLAATPAEQRETAFVRLWCAKEAVLKAHGHGLSFGLHRLEFVPVGDRLELQACDPQLGAPPDWNLHQFTPAPGLAAALAWRTPWAAA